MTLPPGARLGPYEILTAIGAGGMGEVYKARDTRLDRSVAIKVLPAQVSADPERRARFEREARTIAGLSHPHICTLHDVGEHEGSTFLVMEHLTGETLAERLEKGPLPLGQALGIATEIADALAAAHRQGVIHRDLKPGNVMLTKAGAKLLDFGLAKLTGHGEQAAAAHLASTPTGSTPLTGEGMIVGTLQYMAPEQVEGKPTDARTDLFAFGAILYEMLTGKRAFDGTSPASVITAVMSSEPPSIASLQPMTPPVVDWLVKRCLTKDPKERWDSAHDLASELRWIAEREVGEPAKLAQGPAKRRLFWAWAATTLILLLVVAGLASALWRRSTPPPTASPLLARLSLTLAPVAPLTLTDQPSLALSADGKRLVYVAEVDGIRRLYIRDLDRFDASPLSGTDGAWGPFFSPDGQSVGFFADRKLKKVSVAGGAPVTLCGASTPRGGTWGPDNVILFTPAPGAGLWRISGDGGIPRPVTSPNRATNELTHRWPVFLPAGKGVLFTVRTQSNTSFDDAQVAVLSLESGKWRVVLTGGSNARYLPPGYLVYAQAGSLLAAPFDLTSLKVTGPPAPVLGDVAMEEATGAAHFALSESGTLVYVSGGARLSRRRLMWVDRRNGSGPVTEDRRSFATPRFSPDGRRLVMAVQEANDNIWVYDGRLVRRTFAGGSNVAPIWTPDGSQITFSSNRGGVYTLFSMPADGSGSATQLLPNDRIRFPGSWSADGRTLAFVELDPTGGSDIWITHPDRGSKPEPLLRGPFDERDPEFSPDGHWLAYTSNESGQAEVYVRPFGTTGERFQVSADGGSEPHWSRRGRELLYRQGNRIMAAAIETGPQFKVSTPTKVLEGSYGEDLMAGMRNWDLAPDGERFVVVVPDEVSSPRELRVVLGWTGEVNRRVPGGHAPE